MTWDEFRLNQEKFSDASNRKTSGGRGGYTQPTVTGFGFDVPTPTREQNVPAPKGAVQRVRDSERKFRKPATGLKGVMRRFGL